MALEDESWRAVTMGEGMTPVVRLDEDVLLKMDYGRKSSSVGRIYTNKITYSTERNNRISRSRAGNRDRYRTNRESLFMKGILYFPNHLYDPIKSALTIEWLHAHFSTVATSHSVNR